MTNTGEGMGLITGLGKVVFFPIYAPLRAAKNYMDRKKEEGRPYPVKAVVETRFPENYRAYFEEQGHRTDIIGGKVVVWAKGYTGKEIEGFKKKILENSVV
jgi:hypothetical protein